MNIILDLDETLISTMVASHFTHNHQKRANKYDWCRMHDSYIVVARPGLQKFLTWLFKNFNVSIWTAASRGYACFIVKNFIVRNNPERVPSHVFYDKHCSVSKKLTGNAKNLNFLYLNYPHMYNRANTVLIDDRSDICKFQPDNTYNIKSFSFTGYGSYNDTTLCNILKGILSQCLYNGDISPISDV